MSDWPFTPRPAELAESRLIKAILDGTFPPNSSLPPERELATQLGVTRPTLREALQRLSRDGWLEIRQGKPTRVRDYLSEGSLGILKALAQRPTNLPDNFIPDLLRFRLTIAPIYTRDAVLNHPAEVSEFLLSMQSLADEAESFAEADVKLHATLTTFSGNLIYPLIYNGFSQLSLIMGKAYFASKPARDLSRGFYADLLKLAHLPDPDAAEKLTRQVMQNSLNFWLQLTNQGS